MRTAASVIPQITEFDKLRFFAQVGPPKESGCCLWQGRTNNGGYGIAMIRGRPFKAHRVAVAISAGSVNPELTVCHRCDTPGCVNPDHLFEATHAENMRDAQSKGRYAKLLGDANPSRKRPECLVRGDAWQKLHEGDTRINSPRGEKHKMAKLTAPQVVTIRERRAAGESLKTIAADYGVCFQLISTICQRKLWAHI